jgi:hypothetical protein
MSDFEASFLESERISINGAYKVLVHIAEMVRGPQMDVKPISNRLADQYRGSMIMKVQ